MSYPGSKGQAGVWQRIIGQMPPHPLYVEPFFGSGQVFWRKLISEMSIVIDKNPACLVGVTRPGVVTICGDAIRWLQGAAEWEHLPDALIYCDPPYPLSTRKGRRYYKHELTDLDHTTLLASLQALKCRVMISSPPCELYGAALRKWRCLEYDTMTRGGKRRECLWCNFPEPEQLHDWRFAGLNHRQRFGMKRFVRRWLARIEAMPVRKRGYVLHELQVAIAQRQARRGGPLDIATPSLVLAAADAKAGDGGHQ